MATTTYSVTITIAPNTLKTLVKDGFFLYGFKGVQAGQTGRPLVWFKTNQFLELNELNWIEEYHAYIAEEVELEPGTVIKAGDMCPIDLHQLVTADRDGLGVPVEGALPGIQIRNVGSQAFTCGLAQVPPKQPHGTPPQPLCAFDLPVTATDVIVPRERVVLLFATNLAQTGAVEELSFTEAVLIELTTDPSKQVTYDLDKRGWQAAPGVKPIPDGTDLVSTLIDPGNEIPGPQK